MKTLLRNFIFYSKLFDFIQFIQRRFRPHIKVLMLHRVYGEGTNGLPSISISSRNFKALMELLKMSYRIISLEEMESYINSGKRPSGNEMLLTFDDAYEEVLVHALPILSSLSLPSTVFPVTEGIASKKVYWWDSIYCFLKFASTDDLDAVSGLGILTEAEREKLSDILQLPRDIRDHGINTLIEDLKGLEYSRRERISSVIINYYNQNLVKNGTIACSMDRMGIKQLVDCGVSVGSHGVTHGFLTAMSSDEVKNELVRSKSEIEGMLKKPVSSFAYPSGFHSDEIIDLVKAAGYRLAFSTLEGGNYSNTCPYALKRYNIWDDTVCNQQGAFSPSLALWRLVFS